MTSERPSNPLLAPSPHGADRGELIGRDPRTVEAEAYEAAGVDLSPTAMKAIRAKCLDCSGGEATEVRKCTAVRCALWPLRMGSYPKARATVLKPEQAASGA